MSPKFTKVVDGSTSNTALAAPDATAALPAGAINVTNCETVRLMFGGTDAANEHFNYAVDGITEAYAADGVSKAFVPQLAASGVVTLGAKTYGAGGAVLGASANLWADTITDTSGAKLASPFSPANDTIAYIDIRCAGFSYIVVRVCLDSSAAAMDVFVCPDPRAFQTRVV